MWEEGVHIYGTPGIHIYGTPGVHIYGTPGVHNNFPYFGAKFLLKHLYLQPWSQLCEIYSSQCSQGSQCTILITKNKLTHLAFHKQ